MADWKQITARIRRARSGKDPLAQLANLYQKTSDAMVAFELAKLFESSGQNSDAAKWYSTAAARFRRAEWKSKAEEAAVRLGGSPREATTEDRKSTRLNSSHVEISYAVFCLKKKKSNKLRKRLRFTPRALRRLATLTRPY